MSDKQKNKTDKAYLIGQDGGVEEVTCEVVGNDPDAEQWLYKKPDSNDVSLRRSNRFMEAKYKSTLLEKKLLTLGLSKMTVSEGKLVAVMNSTEIKETLGYTGNSLYSQLTQLSAQAIQHYMFLKKDDKNEEFDMISVVDRVRYKDGVMTIYFNDAIKQHTLEVEKKYTTVSRSTLMSLHSVNTFTMYDLMMTQFYKLEDDFPLILVYGVSELKIQMGLIDIYDKKVAAALSSGMDPDEILEKYVPDAPYKDWSNFRRRVLDPVVKEINESNLIQFSLEYEPVKAGKGGRVVSVKFIMRKKKVMAPSRQALERESKVDNENFTKLMEAADGKLTSPDCITLLAKAENDLDKVLYLFRYTQQNPHIRNIVGWMISALDGNWDIPDNYREQLAEDEEKKKKAKAKTSKKFNENFEQREYDFDALEEQLLAAQSAPKKKEEPAETVDLSSLNFSELPEDVKAVLLAQAKKKKKKN